MNEKIKNMLIQLHEDIDFNKNFIEEKILDSFDIVALVSMLRNEFDIEIRANEIIASNFESIDSIADMVSRLNDE